ncbi:CAP domain-containing protein [Gloeobacter kilaueensis]|nr:CAP domain-containing protein [Gloeobacter kilaueensis]
MAPALLAGLTSLLVGCGDTGVLQSRFSSLVDKTAAKQQPAPTVNGDTPQSPALGRMESQVLQDINAIRVRNKLQPLRENPKLAQVARRYSRLMAEQKFFSHYDSNGKSVADRVRSAGVFYLVVGENLALIGGSPRPAPLAVAGWMKSPGHRENILRPVFEETGVGIWQRGRTVYFTQVFLKGF